MEHVKPDGLEQSPPTGVGDEIHALAARLFPVCRSITGEGVRRTLDVLSDHVALERHEVPSGTRVLDWTVPQEWNIRSAIITGPDGKTVVDFADCNLHVVNYSVPFKGILPLDKLRPHIHTLPVQPDLIPYRTSYYAPAWGFCMAYERVSELPDGLYRVEIDSELKDGSLTYGEYLHRGKTEREFLLSAHICHPSLANDNCSGLALLATLAKHLAGRKRDTATAFSSLRARSARSRGWPGTRTGHISSTTDWCSPAWGTRDALHTSAAAAATPSSTAPWPTCSGMKPGRN